MAYLGGFGSNATKTVGATLAITASSTIPAGTLLVLGIGWDNLTATTPTISSVSNSGGGTWSADATGNIGVSATAGSGVFAAVYTTTTTSEITSGATVTTITFSSASTASKAAAIVGYDNMLESFRGAIISGTSTAGTPSAATTTAPVTGDVVVGVIIGENNATPTGDADTLNGSWSTIYGTASSGAGAATNVAVGIQSKTVTAGGNQTFNATSANDAIAFIFTLATPLDASLSGQSTSSGQGTVTALYKPDITGQSTSSGVLPGLTAVNTFILTAQSNSAGTLAAGIRFPTSASGQSNTAGQLTPLATLRPTASGQSNSAGTFAPRITYVPLLTGQSNSNGTIATLGTIRSTMSGLSTSTGSVAAFRAVGASMTGQANSSGSGVITATRRPSMTGQSTSAGAFTPTIAYVPRFTGQSNSAGSFKVGIDSPGTFTATAFTYGAMSVGLRMDTPVSVGQSNSNGSATAAFSLSTSFIGWGVPI